MTNELLPLIPKHTTYVEVFGGAASLLFAKPPSPVEVYNDLDGGLVHFFRTLRNKEQAEELYRLASLTPYSRAEYNECRETWHNEQDPVIRAWKWFVVASMSYAGNFNHSWSFSVGLSRREMAAAVSRYTGQVERIIPAAQRLLQVQIEHSDFRLVLKTYDTPDTFFYVDPTYVPATRKAGGYAHELTAADHAELAELLLSIRGKAILSGYDHAIYAPLVSASWEVKRYRKPCYVSRKKTPDDTEGLDFGLFGEEQYREECLWISPSANKQLSLF